jgi:uncharacterized protein
VHVAQLWVHPVKSFQGEQVHQAAVEHDGVQGDRQWGVRHIATGRVLTGRREPRLLHAAARLVGDQPEFDLPTGEVCRGTGPSTDDALSTWLGAPVSLVEAAAQPPSQAEYFADATDDSSTAIEWTMPPGRFVDAAPLLILSTGSLRAGPPSSQPVTGTYAVSGPTCSSTPTAMTGTRTAGADRRSVSAMSNSCRSSRAYAAPW